jgi:hypothetical protein
VADYRLWLLLAGCPAESVFHAIVFHTIVFHIIKEISSEEVSILLIG